MMCFTAIQCGGPAFNMNWLTILTANALPALVATIAYMRDPTPALYGIPPISLCTFPNSSSESFGNFEFTSNGVPTSLHSSILNRWGPLRCSSFGSWWWYGLLYKSQIPLLGNNTLSVITYLDFLLKLRFDPLQFCYIARQYDQIIRVKDCHQQTITHLFDVQRMMCLAPTKALVNVEWVIRWYHALGDCLSLYKVLLNLHTRSYFPSFTKSSG